MPPRPSRLILPAALALLLLAVVPTLARAHAELKRSSPAAGAHLVEAPRQLRLTFTEEPEAAVSGIQLLGPDGDEIALAPLRVDSTFTLVADVRGALAAGPYTVVWRVAAADGHVTRGRFAFVIAPGAAGLEPPAASAASAAPESAGAARRAPLHQNPVTTPEGAGFGADSAAYVVIRWALYLALVAAIGAVAFRMLVLPLARGRLAPDGAPALEDDAARGAARLGLGAAILAGAAAVARLVAQSYALHGAAHAFEGALVGTMLTRTIWGWGWLLQAAGVVVAMAGFALARRRGGGWPLAGIGVILLAVTPALSGHAAAAPTLRTLAVALDTLHVLGAGGWMGGLLLVVAVGMPAALRHGRDAAASVAAIVNAFSPTALGFAGALVATGAFAAWLHVGSWSALASRRYGQLLLVKLALVAAVAASGAWNSLRVRPGLRDAAGAARLRRSGTLELVLGVLVILVTAVLVATTPPMDMPGGH